MLLSFEGEFPSPVMKYAGGGRKYRSSLNMHPWNHHPDEEMEHWLPAKLLATDSFS